MRSSRYVATLDFQSRIVGGKVHIYRHVYFGKHAEGGRYWERQRYQVDVNTGEIRRD